MSTRFAEPCRSFAVWPARQRRSAWLLVACSGIGDVRYFEISSGEVGVYLVQGRQPVLDAEGAAIDARCNLGEVFHVVVVGHVVRRCIQSAAAPLPNRLAYTKFASFSGLAT